MAQALDLLIVGFLFGIVAHGGHCILGSRNRSRLFGRDIEFIVRGLTVPTIVCPSFKAKCNGWEDTMALTASHCTFTSPANSVLMSSVLASDLTIAPVSRSPFLSVTWSATTLPAKKHNIPVTLMLRRTIVLLCSNFTYAIVLGLFGKGAGSLFLASYPAKSVKSTETIL